MIENSPQYPRFEIYAKAPFVCWLARCRLHPATLGALFFLTVSLPLTLWASLIPPRKDIGEFIGYLENLSWSISILTIFPLLIGATLKFYQDIPALFHHLLSYTITAHCPAEKKEAFWQALTRQFSSAFAPSAILLIALPLNYIYYYQVVQIEPGKTWITDGSYLHFLFFADTGLSAIGVYSAVIQVALIYWLFYLGWNSYMLIIALNRFFTEFTEEISLEPLHPDGCCGLGRLRTVSMELSAILFLVGLYLSLKVIDKLAIQNLSLFSDIGNPVLLACYAIAAPLLFFLPLSTAHRVMQRERDRFLLPIAQDYKRAVSSVRDDTGPDTVQRLEKYGSLYDDLKKRVPVWPFDFRSLQAFFGAVIVPVLPILLPVAVQFIQWLRAK
jgi:hypothetical protein